MVSSVSNISEKLFISKTSENGALLIFICSFRLRMGIKFEN